MTQQDQPRYRRYPSETRVAMLIDAGLACLARGGITAFTVDNICREAGASRGLIAHHFGSKAGLLAAVYSAMYDRYTAAVTPDAQAAPSLHDLVEASFAPEVFNPDSLRIWLALWGEIANSPELRTVHRQRYRELLDVFERAIAAEAARNGRICEPRTLATLLIALTDGLWLEQAIDRAMLSRERALAATCEFIETHLGKAGG
ncbi:MAG: TetR family transcriptional regulator C-terminal domain-containing protein [Rubellimicrobium sp.]|nr:TetR family transcriptional regulator C-terminal domain-containing protein [Rubellimicrobium sp.]